MRKYINAFFLFIFLQHSSVVSAQFPGGNRSGGQNMNMGHFYGKVIDASNNKPVDAASVQLLQTKMDSVTKKRKDVVIAGMLTNKKGEFSLENLPVLANFKLQITAIGYTTVEQKVFFDVNVGGAKPGDYSSMLNAVDKDLGNIKMKIDAQQLQGVTVTSNKPLLSMSIDRKVFNVEKNLTSVGGTGVDVMKAVPGVSVDIDGNVSMRNASPQIFVDGRPSTMTLEQIPADAISSVEIITNPSAKFDASGGGSGILNIILKKNRKAGYNGNVRAGIDSRGRPNLGGDINIKQGKINFFANGNLGSRRSNNKINTTRTDFLEDTTAYLVQNNAPVNKGFFAFGRMGMDYLVDNRNTITISGSAVRGQFKTRDLINIARDTDYINYKTADYGYRNSSSVNNFRNYGGALSFKHNFAKAGKEITADINYNYSKNNNQSDYLTQYFFDNDIAKGPALAERSQGGGSTKFFTAQTDFSSPITDKMKIETGARIATRDFTSFNNNFIQDPSTGDYFTIPLLNNNYIFKDQVLAAYVTFSQQLKKFNYQLGLRVESSQYDGNLISKNQSFSNEYPFSLFPSAFATYKLSDKEDLQLNYSRKINRPNFFQVIPFVDFTDSLNLSKGNPDLVPEFTNLLELSYQNQISNGHTLLASAYFRNTNDLITRFQYKDANPNPSKADSVIINTYANANQSYTYGLELTGKHKVTKWWDLTANLNLFNATIKAANLAGTANSEQFSWFAKLNNNFKLPKNFSIQLSGDYQAKTLISPNSGGGGGGGRGGMFGGGGGFGQQQPSAQGYIRPVYQADFAIKKEFLKNNAASLTLQISDIFRTRVYNTHSESIYFIQDNMRRRDPQVVRLNFNWRFGKLDMSLFKRKNMKGEIENAQGVMQSINNQ